MPLPIHVLPLAERWDCHQCGVCCRGSLVPLSDDDLARLQAQGWQQHPDFRGQAIVVRQALVGHAWRLAHRPDGSCVFLLPDGLCRIHKELGFDAKPLVCRMFPLQVIPRDKAAVLTLRRACPSAAADRGRPLEAQLDFARTLARERKLAEAAPTPPPIKPGERSSWSRTRRLLECFQHLLTDQRYPPIRRLVHALTVCRWVQQARTRRLDDAALAELLAVLSQAAPEESADWFTERVPPSRTARLLFRQTAAEWVRLYPGLPVTPSWSQRWRLWQAAWRVVWGRGTLPRLLPDLPPARFEHLEQPLGALPPPLYAPLNRFLETSAVSWSYALANRAGWSVIESLRMLALSYPIALWLLRWVAFGRAPREEDMPPIITALDRAQGYAPLAGRKQRWRLAVLAHGEQLERLVAWYGR
jgi:lysine-N-methylase